MKRFLIMALLASSFLNLQAQPPVETLDQETAQSHLAERTCKLTTKSASTLLSASEIDIWTDGEHYYQGLPDGNKYQLFAYNSLDDLSDSPSIDLVGKGMLFQNLTEKGTTVKYMVGGPWKLLVFYDKAGQPVSLFYALHEHKFGWSSPSLDYQTAVNGVYSLKTSNANINEEYRSKAHYTKMVFGENWYIPKAENWEGDYRHNDPGIYTLENDQPNHLLMGFGRYKKVPLPKIPKLEFRVVEGVTYYYADGQLIPEEEYKRYEDMMAPGYGGNAAEGDPASWEIELTLEGLTVHAHPTKYISYSPDFGTEFTLTKDCSAYGFEVPGRWAYASVRPLTRYILSLMPKEALVLMRGEIYARHGDTFRNSETQKYFNAQPWYKKSGKAVVLTDIERLNVALIKAEESRR